MIDSVMIYIGSEMFIYFRLNNRRDLRFNYPLRLPIGVYFPPCQIESGSFLGFRAFFTGLTEFGPPHERKAYGIQLRIRDSLIILHGIAINLTADQAEGVSARLLSSCA